MTRWTIDKDHLAEPDITSPQASRVGAGRGDPVTRETPGAVRFRTFDDDGYPVYDGWLIDDGGDAWESALDFASADAGATAIRDGRGKDVIS